MTPPRPLRFDAEGRALEFPTWLIRVELYLRSQPQGHDTLWAHASGDLLYLGPPAALPPQPTPVDRQFFAQGRAALSVWESRDAAARLALTSLLPESEEAHFDQVRSAKECLAAIKTRYSTPTSASLGHLFMPFLFPDLASFDSIAALVTHLRSLDTSYRAACTEA
ncbi:unnamed protein product [Closterium sp. NIES-53]